MKLFKDGGLIGLLLCKLDFSHRFEYKNVVTNLKIEGHSFYITMGICKRCGKEEPVGKFW